MIQCWKDQGLLRCSPTFIAIAVCFATVLLGIDRLAFRDVGHFYTPLYDYVSERTETDWLPLWNPLDRTGVPLLGESTTGVLYPVRYLVFSLPFSTASLIRSRRCVTETDDWRRAAHSRGGISPEASSEINY